MSVPVNYAKPTIFVILVPFLNRPLPALENSNQSKTVKNCFWQNLLGAHKSVGVASENSQENEVKPDKRKFFLKFSNFVWADFPRHEAKQIYLNKKRVANGNCIMKRHRCSKFVCDGLKAKVHLLRRGSFDYVCCRQNFHLFFFFLWVIHVHELLIRSTICLRLCFDSVFCAKSYSSW